jgi:RNA methyltransferase, TrmH family
MTVIELTSKDNPLLKLVRLVALQAQKAPQDLVLAEGVRCIEEAIGINCSIEAVLYSEEFGVSEREARLMATLSRQKTKLYCTSERMLKSVSDVQSPQGVLALVHVPGIALRNWAPVPRPLILCACGLQDPGNLGTLIRTAASASASLVCTTAGTVSPRNPKAIRASAGGFFRLPVIDRLDPPEFLSFCRVHSITPYLTDAQGERSYTDVDYTSGCAILLGNEGRGIVKTAWEDMESIRIPMAPGVESLNVATAGALVLFEAFRQRAKVGRQT